MVKQRSGTQDILVGLAVALAVSLAGSAAQVGAQLASVELVADLGPAPGRPGFPVPHDPIRIGGRILFFASDEVTSSQLWATDGTTAGTLRVRDVGPGILHDSIGGAFGMVAAQNRAFFRTFDALAGTRLWVSDGTRAGTLPIFSAGLPEERASPGSAVLHTAAFGRDLLFLRSLGEERLEVWRSNGTKAGTRRLAQLATSAPGLPTVLVPAAGRVYFMFQGFNRKELWTSDGTKAGTRFVAGFPNLSQSYTPAPIAVGSRLFFVANDADVGFELWTSDGTSAGTRLVRDLVPGRRSTAFSFLAAGRDALFFSTISLDGEKLWRSDGTEAGTVRLPAPAGFGLEAVAPLGRDLLFYQGLALWRTSGDGPPLRLADGLFGCGAPASVGNILYFPADDSDHGCELWRTDGTPEGTALAFDIVPGMPSSQPDPHALGDRLLLFVPALSEIWVAEANRARPLRRPHHEFRSGAPAFLTPLGSGLVFGANGDLRRALWRTDGSADGTLPIETGPGSSFRTAFPRDLITLGPRLAFLSLAGIEIWDGSDPQASPVLLAPDPSGYSMDGHSLFHLGQRAYWLNLTPNVQFPAVPQVELWTTDGTSAGTALVRNLFPAPLSLFAGAGYYVPEFFAVESESALAFFFYYQGSEIWTTDGTANRTQKIFDLSAADDEASARYFLSGVPFAEGFRFTTWGPQSGIQFWQTDGTPEGARVVDRINSLSLPRQLTRNGNLAFFTAADGAGTELWVSDATPFGARRVRDIARGPASSFPQELTVVGGRLFFTADDGIHGRELWSSDGTTAGTLMVADIAPGSATSFPQHLAAIGGGEIPVRLAFAADDGRHGLEPWTAPADGSGASFFADVAPGEPSSSPAEFTSVGNRLYFAAGTRRTGRELWKATLPP